MVMNKLWTHVTSRIGHKSFRVLFNATFAPCHSRPLHCAPLIVSLISFLSIVTGQNDGRNALRAAPRSGDGGPCNNVKCDRFIREFN